jgi:hypothetical protein
MYLGAVAPNFSEMLDRLEALIFGYKLAVDVHGVHDPGVDSYAGFSHYLEERFGTAPAPVIPSIRRRSRTDAEAWEEFWKLLAEFRSGRER